MLMEFWSRCWWSVNWGSPFTDKIQETFLSLFCYDALKHSHNINSHYFVSNDNTMKSCMTCHLCIELLIMLIRKVSTMTTLKLCTCGICLTHPRDHGMRALHFNKGNQCFYTVKNVNLVQYNCMWKLYKNHHVFTVQFPYCKYILK